MKINEAYVFFDEMTWPRALSKRVGEAEWRLRHAPNAVTPGDRMLAASVIASFRQMVSDPREKRQRVVRAIRAAEKTAVPVGAKYEG